MVAIVQLVIIARRPTIQIDVAAACQPRFALVRLDQGTVRRPQGFRIRPVSGAIHKANRWLQVRVRVDAVEKFKQVCDQLPAVVHIGAVRVVVLVVRANPF
jgi:hypothetical protein